MERYREWMTVCGVCPEGSGFVVLDYFFSVFYLKRFINYMFVL